MSDTIPFTYKDGPLFGINYTCSVARPEQIDKPATLHQCSRKPKGATVYSSAQGFYALLLDAEGKAWATHIPGPEDKFFPAP